MCRGGLVLFFRTFYDTLLHIIRIPNFLFSILNFFRKKSNNIWFELLLGMLWYWKKSKRDFNLPLAYKSILEIFFLLIVILTRIQLLVHEGEKYVGNIVYIFNTYCPHCFLYLGFIWSSWSFQLTKKKNTITPNSHDQMGFSWTPPSFL